MASEDRPNLTWLAWSFSRDPRYLITWPVRAAPVWAFSIRAASLAWRRSEKANIFPTAEPARAAESSVRANEALADLPTASAPALAWS